MDLVRVSYTQSLKLFCIYLCLYLCPIAIFLSRNTILFFQLIEQFSNCHQLIFRIFQTINFFGSAYLKEKLTLKIKEIIAEIIGSIIINWSLGSNFFMKFNIILNTTGIIFKNKNNPIKTAKYLNHLLSPQKINIEQIARNGAIILIKCSITL